MSEFKHRHSLRVRRNVFDKKLSDRKISVSERQFIGWQFQNGIKHFQRNFSMKLVEYGTRYFEFLEKNLRTSRKSISLGGVETATCLSRKTDWKQVKKVRALIGSDSQTYWFERHFFIRIVQTSLYVFSETFQEKHCDKDSVHENSQTLQLIFRHMLSKNAHCSH